MHVAAECANNRSRNDTFRRAADAVHYADFAVWHGHVKIEAATSPSGTANTRTPIARMSAITVMTWPARGYYFQCIAFYLKLAMFFRFSVSGSSRSITPFAPGLTTNFFHKGQAPIVGFSTAAIQPMHLIGPLLSCVSLHLGQRRYSQHHRQYRRFRRCIA